MKKYDMHTHTVNSDGTLTVKEIFEKATKIGLSGIAITDHDNIDGWKEAEKYSQKYGIEFIPGVEFSCNFQGKEIHILGYYFKVTEILKNRFEKLKKARDERNQKIIKKLNDLGLKISIEDAKLEAKSVISRAHIANVMLKKGYCYTRKEVFSQYLGSKGAAYIEKKDSDPIEIIKEIKKSGGIAILAHPKLITESKEELKKIIMLFKSAGLDGLELNYPLHTSDDKEFLKNIILKENILYSGGSDFHGKNREETGLGSCFITQIELEKIKKRRNCYLKDSGKSMIIVTGAAGFLGSAYIWKLNEMGINDILAVDKMRTEEKWKNLRKRDYSDWCDRDELFDWLSVEENAKKVTAVLHMGAISATTEKDGDLLMKNNYEYSKKLWNFCAERDITYVYASSAATYGGGEQGYSDEGTPEELKKLLPLNKYGYSKKFFDDWAFKQEKQPKQWIGAKFFNVYGPQEYHKGRMASMVFHTFNQYNENGGVKLFKSHKEGYKDGEQLRDFIYVKDVVDMLYFCMFEKVPSGVYNIGTGQARSFHDLAMETMKNASGNFNLKTEDVIEFIPMPEDLRGRYQYFTEASMRKLREAGYTKEFISLEDGVKDYVSYLSKEDPYL